MREVIVAIVCDFTQMLTSNKAVREAVVSTSVYIDIDISMHVYVCHARTMKHMHALCT